MHLKQILTIATGFLFGVVSLASAQAYYDQPLPRPCTGPACISDYPTNHSSLQYQDTSVIRRSDGVYLRYSKGNDTGLGINVVTALSLSGPWIYAFSVLCGPLKSTCGAENGHSGAWRWAPEIHSVNGTYYLYYTVEYPVAGQVCFDQCVASSPSMDEGSWTDHGSMNLPNATAIQSNGAGVYGLRDPYVRLDGNLLADSSDPQGVAQPLYMVFGSYQFGLYGVPLANLTSAMPDTPAQLIIADQNQPPGGQSDKSGNYTEGPYQLMHGNWIYLFYSRGSCCAAAGLPAEEVYQTQVCRTAKENGPTGEYVDRDGESCRTGGADGWNRPGSIFLYSNRLHDTTKSTVYQPGSVGVLNDPVEGLIMWYQYQNNTGKANLGFGYNYLSFDEDEWPILTAERS